MGTPRKREPCLCPPITSFHSEKLDKVMDSQPRLWNHTAGVVLDPPCAPTEDSCYSQPSVSVILTKHRSRTFFSKSVFDTEYVHLSDLPIIVCEMVHIPSSQLLNAVFSVIQLKVYRNMCICDMQTLGTHG